METKIDWEINLFIENQSNKLCEIIKKNYKECNKNYLLKSSEEYISLVKNKHFMLSDLYDEFALVALEISNKDFFMIEKFLLTNIVFIDEENGIGDVKYFTSIDKKIPFHIKNYFRYWRGCCAEWGDYRCCASITLYH